MSVMRMKVSVKIIARLKAVLDAGALSEYPTV